MRDQIASEVLRIQKTAKAVAKLDVFTSLAYVADKNRYVRPKINTRGVIDIRGVRHPVVENMISNDMFISNDTYLDNGANRISIITGPNMAGKSTYMRQTALIVLMAQVGSFVPADSADIGIVDRIFTRVGASDDLSIAWAVIEHIADKKLLGAKTLFATHYHELTELEGTMEGVNNYCIAVKEKGDDIVFLRKIVKGGADKSYGIQVAKLAGVPESVISRAKELVEELSQADISVKAKAIAEESQAKAKQKTKPKTYDEVDLEQISLFDTVKDDDVVKELQELDISNMTPMDAMNTLYRLQNKLKNRW